MMRKDLALIQTEAMLNGMSLPVASSVLDLFSAAANQGLAELDYSAIVKMIRQINGIR
jgi:3-hydroxyisobutyrate dehydrogenase-like beta-hydroxyacid dehydrogenase